MSGTIVMTYSLMTNMDFFIAWKIWGRNAVPVLEYHVEKGNCGGRRAAEQCQPLATGERQTPRAAEPSPSSVQRVPSCPAQS